MDFKNIDSLFDDAFKRIDKKTPLSSPYNEPPLASDHFLLRRSWEFFQQRANALESEWRQIMKSKEEEIAALREIVRLRDERLLELETENHDFEKLQESFARARLAEQEEFADDTRKLRLKWEEEREALIRAGEIAAANVLRIRAEAERRLEAAKNEVSMLRASLDKARAEIAAQSEKRVVSDGGAAKALEERDEVVRSLESKVDLLRAELERRELALKGLADDEAQNTRQLQELLKKNSESADQLKSKNEQIAFLNEKLEAARRECESLKAGWSREQAEWRELWDRSREMWERKK
jgi:hypothetical protein